VDKISTLIHETTTTEKDGSIGLQIGRCRIIQPCLLGGTHQHHKKG